MSGVRAAVLTAAETLGVQTFPAPPVGGSDVTQCLGKLAGDIPGAGAIGVSIEPGRTT